jgi:hypothetical protein
MLAKRLAEVAKLQAQIAGTFDETGDGFLVTRLKRAIRSRDTALRVAQTVLGGRNKTENSPAVSDIDTKIANAQKRLADLVQTKANAIEVQAQVPFDLETLNSALSGAIDGTVLEFPVLQYRLSTERTEGEVEAGAALPETQDA